MGWKTRRRGTPQQRGVKFQTGESSGYTSPPVKIVKPLHIETDGVSSSRGRYIKTIEFASESNPNKKYEVKVWEDGSLSCNCPGWTFKKEGKERSCKHTDSVKAMGLAEATVSGEKKDDTVTISIPVGMLEEPKSDEEMMKETKKWLQSLGEKKSNNLQDYSQVPGFRHAAMYAVSAKLHVPDNLLSMDYAFYRNGKMKRGIFYGMVEWCNWKKSSLDDKERKNAGDLYDWLWKNKNSLLEGKDIVDVHSLGSASAPQSVESAKLLWSKKHGLHYGASSQPKHRVEIGGVETEHGIKKYSKKLMDIHNHIMKKHGWVSGEDIQKNWNTYLSEIKARVSRKSQYGSMNGVYGFLENENFHYLATALEVALGEKRDTNSKLYNAGYGGLLENKSRSLKPSAFAYAVKKIEETADFIKRHDSWICTDDKERASKIKQNFNAWLDDVNKGRFKNDPVIHLRNNEQAVIWNTEYVGQVSDGIWENDPRFMGRSHTWRVYSDSKIVIDPTNVGWSPAGQVPIAGPRRLLEEKECEARVLFKVRESVNPNYTREDFRKDLRDLSKILKTRLSRS